MRVIFLGTGNAFGSGGRHPISILLENGPRAALLDCGPATLPALKARSLPTDHIEVVLISHHHGDHFSGIPFLLLDAVYECNRRGPLTIAGPPETEQKLEDLTRLLFPGLSSRERPFETHYIELQDGRAQIVGSLEVTPFRVRHFPQGVAFGYRVQWGDRVVVFSGDTEWTDALGRQSRGADLFICECSTFSDKVDYHMSYEELMAHRAQIEARRTVLVHAGEDVIACRSELELELVEEGQEIRL